MTVHVYCDIFYVMDVQNGEAIMAQLLLEHTPVQSSAVIELNIDVFLAPGELYLSYEDHKRIIKGKFNTVQDYMRYVKNHGLEARGLTSNPYNTFPKDVYKGWADFLGIEETGSGFRTWVLEHQPWKTANAVRRQQGEISRQKKLEEKARIKQEKLEEQARKKQLAIDEKARQKQLIIEQKANSNAIKQAQRNQPHNPHKHISTNPLSPSLDFKIVCEFLIDKGMGEIAESIAYHKKLSLSESREVTMHLIEHYKHLALK